MMFIKVQSLEMHMSIMAEMKQEWSMPMSDKMLVHEFYSLQDIHYMICDVNTNNRTSNI